ncbi:type I restriction enzyme, S subunit [Acetoanaerobium noterae]|uniref:Type I restriction enzyme, S subunit n=1 Tax=Acetoanaerobium noterae TaxID=745369 RepID=A0A1T4ZSY5_9FIRM|nr:restriction endonuclease subunit S [Acetoanaerobium noterae]SKB25872.1 type I restriction enzyme, S subunit [Acetoanaerobium noterae]
MGEWKIKRINQLGEISRGRSRHRPRDDKSLYGGEYPFVQTGDVKASEFYLSKYSQTYNEKGLAQSKLWKKGTLCITIAANIAETAILDIDACFPDSIVGFIPFDDEADVRFVKYSFDMLKKEMQLASLGATQDNFSVEKMLKFKFIVPDFKKQKRVSDILSTYDDLIENNNRRVELLEKAAQELYKEWFVRFRFPNHENTKFVNGLPEGWEVRRVKEYGRVETGKTPPTSDPDNYSNEIMFVKTPDMHGNSFVIETEEWLSFKGHKTQPKKLLPENSIMVSCIGTGGVVAINSSKAHTNQQINSIIPDDAKYLEWLYFTCKSLKETIELFGATGATMTNLSKGKFEKLKVINPSKGLVYNFSEKINPIFIEIKNLMKQNQNLKKQRDLLLPRLMSGRLEV